MKGKVREPILFLSIFTVILALLAIPMGLSNMLNTMMNTAYELLVKPCLYLAAVIILMSAVSSLFQEFGVIELLNRLLSPLMGPLFNLPGAAAAGLLLTYLSDNPTILALYENPDFKKCFRPYQIPSLTNFGTSFGMGLIVTTYLLSLKDMLPGGVVLAVICGNVGAFFGAILSTRLMLRFTRNQMGDAPWLIPSAVDFPPAISPSPPTSGALSRWFCASSMPLRTGQRTEQSWASPLPPVLSSSEPL